MSGPASSSVIGRLASLRKYGKLWPDLWEKLKTASPDEDISLIISLDLGSDKHRPQDDDNTYETDEHFMKRLRAYNDAREKRVVDPVRRNLVQLGYEPFIIGGGYLGLSAKAAIIKELEEWPEVRMISLNMEPPLCRRARRLPRPPPGL